MKIILDTNIIYSDFRMTSPDFQILLENCKAEKEQLIIPKVVRDETINKFKEQLEAVKNKTSGEIDTFNKLTDGSLTSMINDTHIKEATKEYTTYIDKIFEDNKVKILPYPTTSHESIAQRAMMKKKPFNTNGKGYRDSLIWENIKEEISQDQEILILPEVAFITKNHKDFATKDIKLHPDLVCELEDEFYNPESIIIYTSLKEYVDKKAKAYFKQEKQLEEKLKKKEFDDLDLHQVTSNYLFENFINYELNEEDVELPHEYENPTISSIHEDYEIEKISVKRISVDKVLIDIEFELEVGIDFFMHKADYAYLDGDNDFSIADHNWNEHYKSGETTKNLYLSMSIMVDTKFEVLSCQINKINNSYAKPNV